MDVRIGAVVLAAGMSRRMGQPKMALPWKETTVLGQVLTILRQASLSDIIVVTGGDREVVDDLATSYGVKTVFNEEFQNDHMLVSLQTGICNLDNQMDAALVVLGDQPQVELEVIDALISTYARRGSSIIIPSYQKRRGHPWLVDRSLWPDLLDQSPPVTLRKWIQRRSDKIEYLIVNTDSIFRDLDTPEDYLREKPSF